MLASPLDHPRISDTPLHTVLAPNRNEVDESIRGVGPSLPSTVVLRGVARQMRNVSGMSSATEGSNILDGDGEEEGSEEVENGWTLRLREADAKHLEDL